jgi:hypothetical protein
VSISSLQTLWSSGDFIMDFNPVTWILYPFVAVFALGMAVGNGQQPKIVSPTQGIEFYQNQKPDPSYRQNQF